MNVETFSPQARAVLHAIAEISPAPAGEIAAAALRAALAFEAAYRAGADAELEACIQWLVKTGYLGEDGKAIHYLRAARRPSPKPPETIEVDGFTYRLVR